MLAHSVTETKNSLKMEAIFLVIFEKLIATIYVVPLFARLPKNNCAHTYMDTKTDCFTRAAHVRTE